MRSLLVSNGLVEDTKRLTVWRNGTVFGEIAGIDPSQVSGLPS